MSGHAVIALFVWGLFAFAVAIDASRRGQHGGFWAVMTLLTGPFGVLVYGLVALVTTDSTDEGASDDDTDPKTIRVCPDCSSKHADTEASCDECGAELGPGDEHPVGRRLMTGSKRYCSNCRSEVAREASACPNCGAVF